MARSRVLVAGTVVVVVAMGAFVRLSGDEGTSAGAAPEPTTTTIAPSPAPTHGIALCALGDRIQSGGLQLVLEGVTDPFESSDAVITSPADRRWVATQIELTNISTQPVAIDGDRQFSLLDGNDVRFHFAETAEHLAAIDGTLQPDQSRDATLIFETPEGARDLRLAFDGLPGDADPIEVALG